MCSTRWETPVPRRWPSWMLPVRTHAWTLTKGALRSSLTKISNPFGKVAKTAPVGGNSSRDGSWAVPLIGAGAGEWEAVVIPLSTPHASAWPRGNAGRWRPVPQEPTFGYLAARASSTAFSSAASSGVVPGSNRARGLPSRPIRNLPKFHFTSPGKAPSLPLNFW